MFGSKKVNFLLLKRVGQGGPGFDRSVRCIIRINKNNLSVEIWPSCPPSIGQVWVFAQILPKKLLSYGEFFSKILPSVKNQKYINKK